MNEEQIAELKALVDELESQGLSTADIQTKVDERKATFVEGKTNGVAETDATVTPQPEQASESTGSDSVGSLLESPKIDPLPKTYDEFRSINETELTNIEGSQQFQDLLMDLSRDTGASKFTQKEAEGGIKGWFKKYYDILTPNTQLGEDLGVLEQKEATEVLDLDYTQEQMNIISGEESVFESMDQAKIYSDLLALEINNIVDNRTLEKSNKRGLELQEKEEILTTARRNLFNKGFDRLNSATASATEDLDSQIEIAKSDGQLYLNRLHSTFPSTKENKQPEVFMSQASVDLYNNLVKVTQESQDKINSLIKERNTVISNTQGDLNSLSMIYGFDMAEGFFKNNFQKTQEIQDYQNAIAGFNPEELYGGEVVEDYILPNGQKGYAVTEYQPASTATKVGAEATQVVSSVLSGFYTLAKKGFTAPAYILAGFNDLLTDKDTYSDNDAYKDVLEEFAGFTPLSGETTGQILDEDGSYVSKPQEYVRFGANLLPFTFKMIQSAQRADFKSMKDLFGKGLLKSTPDLRRNIAMANTAFKITVMDNTQEAEDLGLDGAKAQAYGAAKSLGTGLAQSVFPDINFIKSSAGKRLLAQFTGNLKNASNKQAISGAVKTFFTGIGTELGEEEIEFGLDLANKYAFGLALPDKQDIISEQKQLFAGTLMLSGGLGSIGANNTFNAIKQQTYNGIKARSTELLEELKTAKNTALDLGNTDIAKQVEQGEIFVRNIVRAQAVSPQNVTADQLDLVAQKLDLIQQKEKLDPSFRGEIDEQIKALDQQISESRVQQSRAETEAKIAKSTEALAKRLGVTTDTAKDKTEAKNKLKKLKEQGFVVDEKDSQNYGTILFNDKGETVILYNEEANKQDNVITTKAHELLHAVLLKTVADNPGSATQLGVAVIEALNNVNTTLVTPEYQQRLAGYLEKANKGQISKDDAFEEGLTLLSEAVINGDIVIKETIVDKIKRGLDRIFGDSKARVVFNEGKDVINFIKDYNKSLIKGKISEQVVATAEQGALGTLTQVDEDAEVTQPTAKASTQTEASQRVQEIYDQQGTAGAFEIIEQFKPITSKLVERRSEAPGFDRQLLTDEIETGKRGIIDLINEYDAESGVPLAAYINKFLPARAIESSNRILGEEFTEDVTEARGVVAEETDVEVIAEPKGPKKPTETTRFSDIALSNLGVNKAEAEKQISDATNKAFEGQDVTRFGQTKNVPAAVAEIYGKMFGVNPQTIYDKKRNYSKKDSEGLTRIKQYLIDNATSDFARLPKTKDDFGKATFIPNNVMNALYTDGELTGTLKDYLDLIREKPVKPIYRDRVGQTIRGLFNTSIRNRMVEDLIPSKPERARAGAKFSTRKKVRDTLTPKQAEKLIAVSVAQNINTTLKTLGEESASVKDDTRPAIQRNFLNAIKKHKLRPNVFLGGAFASSGSRYERKADGNVYYKLSNGKEIMGVPRRDADGKIRRNKKGKKLFSQPTAEQVVEQFGEGVTLLPARGKLYYGVKDPAYIEALAAAKENLGGIEDKVAKKVTVKAADTDAGKAQAKVNMEVLEDVVMQLDSAIKAGMPSSLASMVILQGYQATSGLIKIAAPFRYKSKVFKYGTTPKQREGEKFREEHNPPASVIGSSIIFGFSTGTTNIVMPAIKENYYQTKLSKADDQKIDEAKLAAVLPEGYTILDNPAIRLAQAGIDLNSIINYDTSKSLAEELGVSLDVANVNATNIAQQNQLVAEVIQGNRTPESAQKYLNEFTKLKSKSKASSRNNNKIPSNVRIEDPSTFDPFGMVDVVAKQLFPDQANSDAVKAGRFTPYEALDAEQKLQVMAKVPGSPVEQTIAVMDTIDTAIANARKASAKPKGISVWDFDDTLATTKSNVLYTMPDGTEGALTAEQFAKQGEDMLQQGAEFDFSEFEKVTKGAKGPMFEKAVARNRKFGNNNVFILTARTQAAAEPIHEFLKAIGLDIPLKNIVGLGNSTPEAKARWVVGKAAEGYNDFYFADDAYKNVKAVQNALEVLDVKSKTQQAFRKASSPEKLDADFNTILEQTTGIASEKEYKKVKAEVAGASLGRVFRGIPYSAQDFVGLLYETLSKSKLGDSQMAWYKTHLLNPYARAVNDIDNARLAVMADYRALKKQLGFVPKNLRKKIPGEPYSREQAVRVYIWNKLGYDVPGISKQDLKDLSEHVADNADLQVFADQVIAIQKGEYAKPKEGWPAGTITTDIQESINTGVRAKYLTQWQNNVDVIFSEKNMNKLEAAYGKKWRKAMENMLGRMKTGRNRNFSDDSLTARFTDWLQGSIGAIMFFNSRSSLLQNLSSINFLNFTDNNPLAAAKAFANQKQYWSDFSKLINSDFLKARRSGLRMNVNEADIADMAKKGGPRAVISKLLQFGFTPTQVADSFAIASGGATFYRNRIKSLMKQGMSQAEAETQAFEDFRETAEESQQSSRPDRISMQQAGPLGRLILAFQNTPSQYARIIDKSVRDLKNGRGDRKTNISKIIYYSTVQNLLFNALQQALFAFAFDDEEPEDQEKKDKYISIANGMADSLLRGTGVAGGVMSVTKNAIMRIIEESQKDNPNYEKVGADLQRIAPPISSKLSKINQAARSFKWDKDEMINGGWGLDNPAYLAVGNVVSATTNIPMDRAVKKINNLTKASDSELETWERLALIGGWQDWEIGLDEETKKPQSKKVTKRKVKKRKVKKRKVK